jgi:aryl-alcohol dehydrogenase-like predicted oxidoreductase
LRRKAMRYRKLGNTGLKVSEVAFGGGAVGGLMTDNEREEEHLRVVKRRLELGITHFDTAVCSGTPGLSNASIKHLKELWPSNFA